MRLLAWYDRHQRPLPWRTTKSPYRIWVSEIMLQQTRVPVVVERYRNFLKIFPSLRTLAESRESDVLAAWSGLGYYRRARSLRNAARVVVREHRGQVPRELAQLRALPSIGDYTAAAISSIAFGQPHAVVDGNVRRVVTRVSGKTLANATVWKHAQALLSRERPGDFNQAMMELGAVVCVPIPKCGVCPVQHLCVSKGATARSIQARPPVSVTRSVALARRKESVYLVRRQKTAAIMPSMWELPPADDTEAESLFSLKHSITNTNYFIRVFPAAVPPTKLHGRWVACGRLNELPLTGLTRKILKRAGIF